MGTPWSSLLVANRGEIASRVFRTARSMGLRCVAVYADADVHARSWPRPTRPSAWLRATSTARRSSPPRWRPAPRRSTRATASSRRTPRSAEVTAAGLTWVGPPPDVIEAMGDKLAAKGGAIEAGVPTLRSSDDPAADGEIGYPLLVKAAAGGGGKGMRVVESAGDLPEAVAAARREAASGFGDDRVFLERYIARARHVEIQILGDAHGGLVHLGERECSIQRRHQKIVEESPSPVVDADLRAAMGDAALRLARHRLPVGRDRRVPRRRRHPRVLLPRGQHPPAGRAPRHRGGHGYRPRP